jgi:hypothetical protein
MSWTGPSAAPRARILTGDTPSGKLLIGERANTTAAETLGAVREAMKLRFTRS